MNTALSWIKAYVPELSCTDQEYCDAMTLTGTKVEGFERADKNLEKIVVGQILSIEKHPDADKLIVCQVDIGTETIQIVTGAPNVKEGDKVPVVLAGGKVAGGHDGGPLPENGISIKAGKLRGVPSNGMMCSIEELGSSRDMYPEAPENGIYIFEPDVQVGADAVELLGLRDTVFEYEITSNRVDCYSVLGIAREAAATFKKPFVPPVVPSTGNDEDVKDYISVEVKDPDLCTRYCARVCKNIKIGPSPKWMQRRLAASGIRPINNLVDITNYVMEEYGQPMHAYDLNTIAGHKIIVRRAKDGDEFQTLDGQMRKVDGQVLMICDAEKEIGIAGIMGGENSKITEDVQTVLFEAATFNGPNIRKSAKRVGLRTDASGKFEKGLDPRNAEAAINRACQLIEELGCGEVVGGMVDVKEPLAPLRRIPFCPEKINRLLGTDVSVEEMLAIFAREELVYDEDAGELVIPSFRQDLAGTADIAEEVARFYGYDKIPTTLPSGEATTGKLSYKLRIEQKARDIAEYCGFSQGMCYSFESPKVFDKLLIGKEDPARKAITIANPLGEDFSIMRTISLNGMLNSLATNYNRRNKNVKLYELGNIYLPKALPLTELPDERMQFTLGFYGEGDFFTLKGVLEEFFEGVGMRKKPEYDPKAGKPFLHPGRQALIRYEDVLIGYLGEVHPDVLDNYNIGTRAYVAVLDMPSLIPFTTFERKYEGIAKFPSVSRDISMVVPKKVMVGEIEHVIVQRGGKLLESCQLFDIYQGSQIKEGFKSVAYSITFRAKDRTLLDSDVNAAMKKILNGLEQLGIELRQ
ncbi:MAG TPA: phenylalanine--tRNA ligase subunit beta [Candidatus Acetatifactor stercoripullorum]|uniref:Phenylalanine--tRNA ligase beta subunit n=1 Tax=Candidatus Acetatifactor stercoripullorum TaxID=2838414 RepID=A0A9D1UAV7_9FIRM|nr:phenylalanine--tRNA ligase subunit beta [uncultured Acetatifactor sp.]HIW80488.1 phenylalanine--tRNA ligase subunit beta [Candidatus Acetatifactor stercoripullorum]